MKTIRIKKNWFFSAGAKYGWVKDGLDVKGVGIRLEDIKDCKFLKIEINGEEYLMDCKEALVFIEKYKSIFVAGGSTEIGVVSKGLLRKITRGYEEEIPVEEEVLPEEEIENEESFDDESL